MPDKFKTIIKIFEKLEKPKDPLPDFQIWVTSTKLPKSSPLQTFLQELAKKNPKNKKAINQLAQNKDELWALLMYGVMNGDRTSIIAFFEKLESLGAFFEEGVENLFWSNEKIGEEEAKKFSMVTVDRKRVVLRNSTFGGMFMSSFGKLWTQLGRGNLYLWGILSRLFAAEATGDVHCFLPEGLVVDNFFWTDELPVLRALQMEGIVDNIYMHVFDGKDWLPVFEIDNGGLMIVGAQEYSALTHTERKGGAIKLDKPIDVQWFKRVLLHNNTLAPFSIIFREFRYRTWTVAKLAREVGGWTIELSCPRHPYVHKTIVLNVKTEPETKLLLPRIEAYLLANFQTYLTVPDKIEIDPDAILANGEIQVFKSLGAWRYVEALRTAINVALDQNVIVALEGLVQRKNAQVLVRDCAYPENLLKPRLNWFVDALVISSYARFIPHGQRAEMLSWIWHAVKTGNLQKFVWK